jgi:tetratricopeptide (TPR) repeat protein
MLDRAIVIDLSGGLKSPPVGRLESLGDVLRHQGELLAATKTYQDALTQSRAVSDKSGTAYALMDLGNLALIKADFKEARKNYEEALAIRIELGEKRNIATTRVELAQLAIEEKRPSDAVALIKSAIEEFRNVRSSDDELAATVVLVRALLLQGKLVDASRELAARTALAAKSQSPTRKSTSKWLQHEWRQGLEERFGLRLV